MSFPSKMNLEDSDICYDLKLKLIGNDECVNLALEDEPRFNPYIIAEVAFANAGTVRPDTTEWRAWPRRTASSAA